MKETRLQRFHARELHIYLFGAGDGTQDLWMPTGVTLRNNLSSAQLEEGRRGLGPD